MFLMSACVLRLSFSLTSVAYIYSVLEDTSRYPTVTHSLPWRHHKTHRISMCHIVFLTKYTHLAYLTPYSSSLLVSAWLTLFTLHFSERKMRQKNYIIFTLRHPSLHLPFCTFTDTLLDIRPHLYLVSSSQHLELSCPVSPFPSLGHERLYTRRHTFTERTT